MSFEQPTFHLVRNPWIPFVDSTGDQSVALREALVRAHELPGLPAVQPLQQLPLVRLLVALNLAIFRPMGIADIEKLWRAGHFDPGVIDEYLSAHADRFDLFHPEHPFLQVAGLQPTSGGPKPATAMLLNVASGNNVPLFSPFTEGDRVTVPSAEAVLHLLALLAYETAAIKTGAQDDPQVSGGKTTGNPTGPLGQLGGVMLVGRTLFETILLNTPALPPSTHGTPTWEQDFDPTWTTRPASSIEELLVWPSRRVRLVPTDDGTGVTGIVITAGDRLEFTPPHLEPHTRWRSTKDAVALRPQRWQPGSFAWRGLDTLLALDEAEGVMVAGGPNTSGHVQTARVLEQAGELGWLLGDGYPLSAFCVGVAYGNQSAIIEDVFVDTLPLPMAALRQASGDVLNVVIGISDSAERVRRALNNLHDNLRLASGGEKLPWDKGIHPGNDLMVSLTTPTHRLLRGLQHDPDKSTPGQLAWELTVWQLAWDSANAMLDEFARTALQGRTVKVGSSERPLRLADAQAWFGAALRAALPQAAMHHESNRQTSKRRASSTGTPTELASPIDRTPGHLEEGNQ